MKKEELDYWADRMKFDRETHELEEDSQNAFSAVLIMCMVVAVIMIIYLT
jgi:hypothetical protein